VFRFASPYFFFLFLPLGLAAWFLFRKRARQGLVFAPLARVPVRHALWRKAARLLCPALFLVGMALTIVALARPQTVFSRVRHATDAIAIEMAVDISGSMQALDFSTQDTLRSRLDVVKETFAAFVKERPDDLIGLVTFGGYAATRTPLTLDHDALQLTLKAVEIPKNVYDSNGRILNTEELMTAIGDGLATATARVQPSEVKSKIVVLLTDGESNTGMIKPDEAAKAAKALGIRVYTIGVGTTGRAPFIARDMFGRNVIQYAEVAIDEDLLRSVAKTTGGRYFNVRDPKGLKQALADINRLERTKVDRQVYEQYSELFPYWLVPGAALIVLAISLNMGLAKSVL
jgi:Ca-activated chloride channel homolog